MMLKWGLELTLPVEKSEAAGYPIWSVACDELVCCMSRGLTIEALEAIADMEPGAFSSSIPSSTTPSSSTPCRSSSTPASAWAVRSN